MIFTYINTTRILTLDDFRYYDFDFDLMNFVVIKSLPDKGQLFFNSIPVIIDQQLLSHYINYDMLSYIPPSGDSGCNFTKFEYTVNDGFQDSEKTYILDINIIPQDISTLSLNGFLITEKNIERVFTVDDFKYFKYIDFDFDELYSIKITNLPTLGTLFYKGRSVIVNEEIKAFDISVGKFSFLPLSDDYGCNYSEFEYKVNDGISDSTLSYKFRIHVFPTTQSEQLPIVQITTLVVYRNVKRTITLDDLNLIEDDRVTLDFFRITTIPHLGTLFSNGVPLTENSLISLNDIITNTFSYLPNLNEIGSVYSNFDFTVNNGQTNSKYQYRVIFNVINAISSADNRIQVQIECDRGLGRYPSGLDQTFRILENSEKIFTEKSFGYSDSHNLTLDHIKIKSLPDKGFLKLNSIRIVNESIITINDLINNRFRYLPNLNESSDKYTKFKFKVNNGLFDSLDEFTIQIDVIPLNNPPRSQSKTVSMDENTIFIFGLSDFKFIDPDINDSLSAIIIDELPYRGTLFIHDVPAQRFQQVTAGDLNFGRLTYQPPEYEHGIAYTTFKFKVVDSKQISSLAAYTISIDVQDIDNPPTAEDNLLSVFRNETLTFKVADFHYFDPDGDLFHHIRILNIPQRGTFQLNGIDVQFNDLILPSNLDLNQLTYKPNLDRYGENFDNFRFVVSDGINESKIHRIIINVDQGRPVSQNFTVTMLQGKIAWMDVNQFKIDFYHVDLDNYFIRITELVTQGDLKLNNIRILPADLPFILTANDVYNYKLSYKPREDGHGDNFDFFKFYVNDGLQDSLLEYKATFNVDYVLQPPTAEHSTIELVQNSEYILQLNDFHYHDVNNHELYEIIITQIPSSGTLLFNSATVYPTQIIAKNNLQNNILVYTPERNDYGTNFDSFDFVVNNGYLNSKESYRITFDVVQKVIESLDKTILHYVICEFLEPPIASDSILTIDENVPYTFQIDDFSYASTNIRPLESVRILNIVNRGEFLFNTNLVENDQIINVSEINQLVYQPPVNKFGENMTHFDFKVSDPRLESDLQYKIQIDVNHVNRPPVALSQTVTLSEDDIYIFDFNDFGYSDPDDDRMDHLRICSLPQHGLLHLDGVLLAVNDMIPGDIIYCNHALFTYSPQTCLDNVISDSFTFKVNDGQLDCIDTYTLSFIVNCSPLLSNNINLNL
jgi:hypothetical protein